MKLMKVKAGTQFAQLSKGFLSYRPIKCRGHSRTQSVITVYPSQALKPSCRIPNHRTLHTANHFTTNKTMDTSTVYRSPKTHIGKVFILLYITTLRYDKRNKPSIWTNRRGHLETLIVHPALAFQRWLNPLCITYFLSSQPFELSSVQLNFLKTTVPMNSVSCVPTELSLFFPLNCFTIHLVLNR